MYKTILSFYLLQYIEKYLEKPQDSRWTARHSKRVYSDYK